MNLAIIGAAELGKLIAFHAENDLGYKIIGFFDDFCTDEFHAGYPVLGKTNEIEIGYKLKIFDCLMIGIGYNHMEIRSKFLNQFKGKIPFANIIHSTAYIDKSCVIGEGVFILPRVVIDMGVIIEDNVLLNIGCIIAHHSIIGRNSFLAPGVHIAGLVNIESQCFIGIGAIVIDCITIKESSTIGAGTLVLSDTEVNSISVGVPSKIIRYK